MMLVKTATGTYLRVDQPTVLLSVFNTSSGPTPYQVRVNGDSVAAYADQGDAEAALDGLASAVGDVYEFPE